MDKCLVTAVPCTMHRVADGCTSAMFGDLVCGDEPCQLMKEMSHLKEISHLKEMSHLKEKDDL